MKPFVRSLIQAGIVLIPTYIVAYTTDKMVYTIPMLAAMSFIAASLGTGDQSKKVDDVAKEGKD